MDKHQFKLTIEEIFEDLEEIGEVAPGIYYLGNGVYTGKQGWEEFCKAIKEEVDKGG